MEDLVTDAGKQILGLWLAGPIAIIMGAIIVVIFRLWRSDIDKAQLKIAEKEKELADAKREHLEDIKEYATLGEAVRDQIKTLVTAIQVQDATIKEWTRRA